MYITVYKAVTSIPTITKVISGILFAWMICSAYNFLGKYGFEKKSRAQLNRLSLEELQNFIRTTNHPINEERYVSNQFCKFQPRVKIPMDAFMEEIRDLEMTLGHSAEKKITEIKETRIM